MASEHGRALDDGIFKRQVLKRVQGIVMDKGGNRSLRRQEVRSSLDRLLQLLKTRPVFARAGLRRARRVHESAHGGNPITTEADAAYNPPQRAARKKRPRA